MTWKYKFDKEFVEQRSHKELDRYVRCEARELENFISTQIIAKLIDEIPDQFKYNYPEEAGIDLKQQLRDKWLWTTQK